MDKGWIKIHRQLRDSSFYTNPAALSTWIECLLRASHLNREFFLKREKVTLDAGQFVMGRDEFGKAIGVSGSTAWYWLLQFEADSMVDIKKTTKGSIVSVKNWVDYQGVDSASNNRKTADEQRMNTNKNDKNDKNDKKALVSRASPDDVAIAKELFVMLLNSNPAFKQQHQTLDGSEKKVRGWAEDIRLMKERDGRTNEQVLSVIKWIGSEHGTFWQSNIMSGKKLREKYNTLIGQMKTDHAKENKNRAVFIS